MGLDHETVHFCTENIPPIVSRGVDAVAPFGVTQRKGKGRTKFIH